MAPTRHILAFALLTLTLTASPALAQVPLDVRWSSHNFNFAKPYTRGPESMRLPVTHAELRTTLAYLRLDAEQRTIAMEQHREMVRNFQVQWLIAAEEILDKRAQTRLKLTDSAVYGDAPQLRRAFEDKADQLAKDFNADLQLLLNPDQQARYTRLVEGRERLAIAKRNATYPLEAVDLEIVVGVSTLDHATQASLAPILSRHSSAIDALIAAKAIAHETLSNSFTEARATGDAAIARSREVGTDYASDAEYKSLDLKRRQARKAVNDNAYAHLEASRKIATLNHATVAEIRAALTTDEQRDAFNDALNQGLPKHQREAPPLTPQSGLLQSIETLLSIDSNWVTIQRNNDYFEPNAPGVWDLGLNPEPLTDDQRAAILEIKQQAVAELAALLKDFPVTYDYLQDLRSCHSHDWSIITDNGVFDLTPGTGYGNTLGPAIKHNQPSYEDLEREDAEIHHRQHTIEEPYKQRLRELLTLPQRAAIINRSL